jgi:DNA/RNA endonuclease G (NUC1)
LFSMKILNSFTSNNVVQNRHQNFILQNLYNIIVAKFIHSMPKIQFVFFISVFFFLIISCSQNENNTDAEEVPLNLSMDTTRFVAAEGHASLLIETPGTWEIKEADNQSWISFSSKSGNDTMKIQIHFEKNSSSSERFAQLVVSSGITTKRLYVSQKPASDGGYVFNGNYFEMPKDTTIENCIKLTRFLPGARSYMRNYTMFYDTSMKLAYWVAYPLHENYIGSTSRTEEWAYDPLILSGYQANLFGGISGYDRGHQLPSADRTYNVAENYTTFYFSNMTAQNSVLNQGIWVDLENQIRTWTKNCDTMYVVTGAMIKTSTDNSVSYVLDKVGAKFALPKYYFKALAQKRGSNYYTIAYKINNANPGSSATFTSFQMNVSQLEKETGFTFFPALSETIKGEINTSIWK